MGLPMSGKNKPASDLDTNREIRRILVKHWIDLGRVAVRTAHNRVTIYGTLQHLPGTRDELRPEIVKTIFDDIKKIDGVMRVTAKLDNWSQDGTLWKPFMSENLGGVPD